MMAIVEPHTVYVDDSGTDSHARIVVAAFCISPARKWKTFGAAWRAIEQDAGFRHFHMTEFASCRKDSWCRDCKNGDTDESDHPWREWSNTKRKEILGRLVRTVCKYTERGFGIAVRKEDIRQYVVESPLRTIVPGAHPQDPFVFAATVCGGELGKWRAQQGAFPPLKFVFDIAPQVQKDEIARAFLAAGQTKPRYKDGVEQWFDLDRITYESRRDTVQLLSADMLAWVTAKIRAAALFPNSPSFRRGWGKEVSMVAFPFVDSGNMRIGYNTDEQLKEWLANEIAYYEALGIEKPHAERS